MDHRVEQVANARRTEVTLAAVLSIFLGAFHLLGALLLLTPMENVIVIAFDAAHLPMGIVLVVTGVGVARRKNWSRTLGLIAVSATIIAHTVGFLVVPFGAEGIYGATIVLIIGLVLLYMLVRGNVF